MQQKPDELEIAVNSRASVEDQLTEEGLEAMSKLVAMVGLWRGSAWEERGIGKRAIIQGRGAS